MYRFSTLMLMLLVVPLVACDPASAPSARTPLSLVAPTETDTPGSPELTSTAIVAAATEMGVTLADDMAAVPLAVGICEPGRFNSFDGNLSGRIQNELDAAGIKDTFVSVMITEQTEDCIDNVTVESLFAVNANVNNLTNLTALGDRAADILSAMSKFPPKSPPGGQSAILSLRFDQGDDQRLIEVSYQEALDRVADGLRGTELLTALGGLRSGNE